MKRFNKFVNFKKGGNMFNLKDYAAQKIILQIFDSIVIPYINSVSGQEEKDFCRVLPGNYDAYEVENPYDKQGPPFIIFLITLKNEIAGRYVGTSRKALEENFSEKIKIIKIA